MSDFDEQEKKDQEYRKELIELKKVRQGQLPNVYAEERAEEEQKPKAPMTFKQKIANFWYHYRGTVIVVVVLLAIMGYLVGDLLFEEKYDLTVVVSTSYPMSTIQAPLETVLEEYATDYDGNGEVNVGVSVVNIRDPESGGSDTEMDIASKAKIIGMLTTGDPILFLVDDVSYEYMYNGDFFTDLSGYAKDGSEDSKNIKEKRFYIGDTTFEDDLMEEGGLIREEFPDDLTFVLRDFEGLNTDDSDVKKNYEYTESVVTNLVNGVHAGNSQ